MPQAASHRLRDFFVRRVLLSDSFVLFLTLAYFLVLWIFLPRLGSVRNLSNLSSNVWPLLMLVIGQMFVLIVGGIDLSQTAIMAITSVSGALIMTSRLDPELFAENPLWGVLLSEQGGPLGGSVLAVPAGIALMLLIGVLIGAGNGLAVARLRMPPFMVTLVSMFFFSGLAIFVTRSENVSHLPDGFVAIGQSYLGHIRAGRGSVGLVPYSFFAGVALAVAAWFVLAKTILGRWFYAVGINRRAAEVSGVPEVGAQAALRSARTGQQLAMMNVETDVTVGPLLCWYARQNGVLYALAAGDEPAACKELYDFAEALGFTIVAAGKGKNNPLDRYAAPTDAKWAQEASRRGLNPNMLIEFVDGSKTMIEMAAVSNATGLVPDVRGMHGPTTTRDKLNQTFALRADGGILTRTGVVDYGIGGIHPGVFLVVTTSHPRLRQALVYRDMGDGPYYTLFRPYHLCSIEVPLTCAMLVIRGRSNMAPLPRLVSEVFAVAKRPLEAGDILDGIGGSAFYSLIDTYETCRQERLLPAGLAKAARLTRALDKDQPITYKDVELSEPSTLLELRRLQDNWMDGRITEEALLLSMDAMAID